MPLPVWEAEGLGLRVGATGPAPVPALGPSAARDSIELRRGACVRTTGEEFSCNGHGLWVKLTKVQDPGAREAPGCSPPHPHIELT